MGNQPTSPSPLTGKQDTRKICSECRKSKPYSEFYKHGGTPDGLRNKCKICSKNTTTTVTTKTEPVKTKPKPKLTAFKICSGCEQGKILSDFYKHPGSPDGYKSRCKQCEISGGAEERASPDWFREYGYLYVIMEREFIKTGEKIFKIGMTDQYDPGNRLKSYPKSSKVFLVMCKENSRKSEINAINMLNARGDIKHRTDIGNEYYEGELQEILNVIVIV